MLVYTQLIDVMVPLQCKACNRVFTVRYLGEKADVRRITQNARECVTCYAERKRKESNESR